MEYTDYIERITLPSHIPKVRYNVFLVEFPCSQIY